MQIKEHIQQIKDEEINKGLKCTEEDEKRTIELKKIYQETNLIAEKLGIFKGLNEIIKDLWNGNGSIKVEENSSFRRANDDVDWYDPSDARYCPGTRIKAIAEQTIYVPEHYDESFDGDVYGIDPATTKTANFELSITIVKWKTKDQKIDKILGIVGFRNSEHEPHKTHTIDGIIPVNYFCLSNKTNDHYDVDNNDISQVKRILAEACLMAEKEDSLYPSKENIEKNKQLIIEKVDSEELDRSSVPANFGYKFRSMSFESSVKFKKLEDIEETKPQPQKRSFLDKLLGR
jgi:hypothetical protein